LQVIIKPLVEARNICVERSNASILHDISLTINHGECVALLGANGSGKSTLLHALVGLVPISSGTVELCAGHDGQTGIALVPQFAPAASLIPLTVYELVATGLVTKRSLFGYNRSQRKQVNKVIEKVGLAAKANAKYASLSGGQLRRALIARALVADAELLLLDEPLTGLDRESIRTVVELLRDLRNSGHSMIVVSHELADLESLFTRVIELNNRKIAYDGVPLPRHHHEAHHHDYQATEPELGLLP
jgi:zinc transport system ATP-binding protein